MQNGYRLGGRREEELRIEGRVGITHQRRQGQAEVGISAWMADRELEMCAVGEARIGTKHQGTERVPEGEGRRHHRRRRLAAQERAGERDDWRLQRLCERGDARRRRRRDAGDWRRLRLVLHHRRRTGLVMMVG